VQAWRPWAVKKPTSEYVAPEVQGLVVLERRTNGHDKKEANNGGQAYRFDINSRQDEASNYTVLKRFWLSHTKKFT
jgi:hypothetical protein